MASLLGLLILGQTHRHRLCERTSRFAVRAEASGRRETGQSAARSVHETKPTWALQRPVGSGPDNHTGDTGAHSAGAPGHLPGGNFLLGFSAVPHLSREWCVSLQQGAGRHPRSQSRRGEGPKSVSSPQRPLRVLGAADGRSPRIHAPCSSEGGKQSRGHPSSTCWGSHIRATSHWALQGAGSGLCVWGRPCPAEERTRPRGSALQLCPGDGGGGQAVPVEVACPFPPPPWLLPSNPK